MYTDVFAWEGYTLERRQWEEETGREGEGEDAHVRF